MNSRSSGITTFAILLIVFAGFGYLLYQNAQPSSPLRAIVPTQLEPTVEANPWQEVLRPGFGDNSTPLPTIAIPSQAFVAPTLIPGDSITAAPIQAQELNSQELYTLAPPVVGVTPTPLPPTPTISSTQSGVEVESVAQEPTRKWQPPSLPIPQRNDPLGRDHYEFSRPVDPSGQNYGSFDYPYGANGRTGAERIHTGIDMPNDVGAIVRAAGSGTVIFATSEEGGSFQNSPSYGNVVFIEHDFGWDGQPLYTLYAHMLQPLVKTGDYVERGDAIGLNGNTGNSTGPHVHFEVRFGGDRYGDTYNPVLWMVPYVGHGTIAGSLTDQNENFIDDADITLRDWRTGLPVTTTTTYNFLNNVNDVNPDPNWGENFAFGNVPVGRYEVVAVYEGGTRLSKVVDVEEGLTTFVDLHPQEIATAQPVVEQP